MKKVLLAAALLVGFAASAQAAIVNTKHDLSQGTSGSSVYTTGTNQVCVFCHAPHNAAVNKLLWNRTNVLSGGSFAIYTSYNSSAMRTALIARTALSDNSNSLLCLSCHSLNTSAALASNTKKSGLTDATTGAASTRWANTTGNMTNLTNDHPVGISYATARGADNAGFATPAALNGGPIRFFSGTPVGSDSMECASCHSVHDNTNGKFLVMSNDNSTLCTTCHINK